uniref:ATP synthase membrane subunit DAPIT n=1 Tax=Ailuropoda melanoleuca TaxID=9646 RepID=A0A7N5KF62_AILME
DSGNCCPIPFHWYPKIFNSYTLTGRMNCVLATYGGISLIGLYCKLRSKNTPAVKAT